MRIGFAGAGRMGLARCAAMVAAAALAFGGTGGRAYTNPRVWVPPPAGLAGPPATWGTGMAYDPRNRQVVLFGGLEYDGRCCYYTLSDTWTWDGFLWTRQTPATTPEVGYNQNTTMVYDAARGEVVMLAQDRGTTWTWDGVDWTQHNVPGPGRRSGSSMAYDPATRTVVLFGGHPCTDMQCAGTASSSATWSWNGAAWTRLSPLASPPARQFASLAFDSTHNQLVLFGGTAYDSREFPVPFNDTWTWDGTTWTRRFPATLPPVRWGAGMEYDAADRHLLLVGGMDADFNELADDWIWTGRDWQKVGSTTTATAPSGPYLGMAWDPVRSEMVVFDGRTWTYGPLLPSPIPGG